MRSELGWAQRANNPAPEAAPPSASSYPPAPSGRLDHALPDHPVAAARASLFFLDIIRTDALPAERQAKELQTQARRLPQLSQSRQADGFNLMLAMSGKLPVDQQAPVLAALAPRLRTLKARAQRTGFAALATSIARLPQANRAAALPALARALPSSGRDASQFHAVRAMTQSLDAGSQGRALPGLIRHIGVLPQAQRKAAFDAVAQQAERLPPIQQRNALLGLAGKIGRLPADQQAPATVRLQQQAKSLLQG